MNVRAVTDTTLTLQKRSHWKVATNGLDNETMKISPQDQHNI